MPYSTPVPTPDPKKQVLGANTLSQQQTTADPWNSQWNSFWNKAWNEGYNNNQNFTFGNDSFSSANKEGYAAGYQKYLTDQTGRSSGGGGNGLVLGDNKVNDPYPGLGDTANTDAQTELDNALAEYDRTEEAYNTQVGQNETTKNRLIGEGQTELGKAQKSGEGLITDAQQSTLSEEQKSLSTAQDTQKANRNVLRVLGILSSSAAGEMLTKPMESHAQNVAELGQLFIKRKQQVQDWITQKGDEFNTYKTQLEEQYGQIVQNIQQDIRFNRQRKVEAIQAAQTALKAKISDLNAQAMQYQTAAKQYNDNLAMQLAQIALYQNPTANVNGILSKMIKPEEPAKLTQASVLDSDYIKRQQEQLRTLSGSASM